MYEEAHRIPASPPPSLCHPAPPTGVPVRGRAVEMASLLRPHIHTCKHATSAVKPGCQISCQALSLTGNSVMQVGTYTATDPTVPALSYPLQRPVPVALHYHAHGLRLPTSQQDQTHGRLSGGVLDSCTSGWLVS
jgi:hypothetical protein